MRTSLYVGYTRISKIRNIFLILEHWFWIKFVRVKLVATLQKFFEVCLAR